MLFILFISLWLLSITVSCMQPGCWFLALPWVMNKSHKQFKKTPIPPLECGNRNGRYFRLANSVFFFFNEHYVVKIVWVAGEWFVLFSWDGACLYVHMLFYALPQAWFPWTHVIATGIVGRWRRARYSLVTCDCKACKGEMWKNSKDWGWGRGGNNLRMLENSHPDWPKWKQRWLKQKNTLKNQFRALGLNLLWRF